MKWVDPGAFWLLGLTIPIAALFFYRRRAISLTVPSLQFWQPSGKPRSLHLLGRCFSNIPTLLVALLILALLVTALADPSRPRRGQDELVLVIDVQASMQTIEPNGRTRLELAKHQALQAVADTPGSGVFSLIRAGMLAEIVLARCDDRARVEDAIRAIEADDTSSDLGPALELASSVRTAGRQTHLIVLSDFVGHSSVDSTALPSQLDLRRIGTDQPNVGIAGLSRSESADELRVRLRAHNMTGREVTLKLTSVDMHGMPIETHDAASVALSGRGTEVALPCRLAPGVPFRVDVAPDDALPLDNTAWGVWPQARTIRVRLVTRGNAFLKAALSADPAVHLEVVHPEAWPRPGDAEVTIFDASPPVHTSLVPGRYLVFGCEDPFGLVRIAPSLRQTDLAPTDWAGEHPTLQDVDLASWKVGASAGMEIPSEALKIVASGKTGLVFEARATNDGETATAVFFNFALGDSNLVLRPTFPVLLWNTVDYLLGRDEWDDCIARGTGTPLIRSRLKHPAMTITDPEENRGPLIAQGDRWYWANTSRQGLYRVEWDGGQEYVAFNSMNTGLTAPPPDVPPAEAAQPTREASVTWWWSALAADFARPWRLLLAAALVLVVVEWVLIQFRVLKI